ncbi:MAG TPA: DUF92 domain-containing protein [Thermomicrobiales bacterium]|nr:DUF92 domain-containing protein [Thermomicrobiales bacterium]
MDRLVVSPIEFAIAVAAAAVIAALALRKRLLGPGGAVTAPLLGPGLVAAGDWWLGALLIGFFLTSSLLPSTEQGGPARTAWQVLANGGPALVFGTLAVLTGEPAFLIGAATTIAAATSDTWATELGKAFGGTPLSIRSGQRVPPGTSGAVSGAGTGASVAGAVVIAALAWWLSPLAPEAATLGAAQVAVIAACGVLGSAIDTLLGGTLQARFRCDRCGKTSESPSEHELGHRAQHASGVAWMTNSTINLIAVTSAGSTAVALGMLAL